MKTTSYTTLFCALILSATTNSAFARVKANKTEATQTVAVSETRSAPSSSNSVELGAGLTSADSFTGFGSNSIALSMMIAIQDRHMIQPLLAINGTSSGFGFGVGGLYKYRLIGTDSAGFHIGGGFALGTVGTAGTAANAAASAIQSVLTGGINTINTSTVSFAMSWGAVAGIGFSVARNVILHFDASPVVNIIGGSANFKMSATSGLLGASVHYIF